MRSNHLGNYKSRKTHRKTNRSKPKKHEEDILEEMVAEYLQKAYSSTVYHFDVGAGRKTTMFQASRSKKIHGKWSRGYPDLFIATPNKYYHGLYIELKADGKSPFKKDGKLKKSEHLEKQNEMHQKLRDAGYFCVFAVGFSEAKEVIDNYMEQR